MAGPAIRYRRTHAEYGARRSNANGEDPNGLLPLGELVSFRVVEEIVPILRDNGQRREAIMVNLGGRDVEGYVNQAKQRTASEVKISPG